MLNHRRIRGLFAGALIALPGMVLAQGRQVSGTVTRSGTGAPIAEAIVSVVGTAASARTDAQGRYTLSVPAGEVRLTARAIGFTRKDVILQSTTKNVINFVLDQDVFK